MCAKLLSALKEVLSAAIFGVGDDLDTFNLAFTLASLVLFVVGGAFQVSVVPIYLDVKQHLGEGAAGRLLSSTLLLTGVCLLALIALVGALLPWLLPYLAKGFNPQKINLTATTWYCLIPLILISGVGLILAAALNAEEKFTFAALAPGLTSLCIVFALMIAGHRLGTLSLTVGIVIGSVLEFAFLLWALGQIGIHLPWKFELGGSAMRRVTANAIPVIWASVVGNLVPVIEQSFAAHLRPGDVAALGFGYRTIALFLSLFSMAVGSAVLPYFSKLAANEDWEGLRRIFLGSMYRLVLPLSLCASVVLTVFSEPIVRLLFQRGAFTEQATQAVASIQFMYALQFPAYLTVVVGGRVLNAMQAGKYIIVNAIVQLVSTLVLNSYLSRAFGVRGIALSTALSFNISAIIMTAIITIELEKRKRLKAGR